MRNNHISYLIEIIRLSFLSLKEYKINFYFAIITQIFSVIPYMLFVFFIGYNFADTVNWESKDFILYSLILITYNTLLMLFTNSHLQSFINYGSFNSWLSKPINIFFTYFFSFSSINFLFFIMNFILLIIYLIYQRFDIYNILYATLFFLLLYIYSTSKTLFIQSFEFIKLGLSNTINIINMPNAIFGTYPSVFFEKNRLFKLFFIFEFFCIGTLIIPTIKGIKIKFLSLQLFILISLTMIFVITTYINWRRGLKKYEAFG